MAGFNAMKMKWTYMQLDINIEIRIYMATKQNKESFYFHNQYSINSINPQD